MSGWRFPPGLSSSAPGAPSPRYGHSAIFTGTVMILFGGTDDFGTRCAGAVYDPSADTWTTPSYPNLSSSTGINVWGGQGPPPIQSVWGDGAIYRP